MPRATRAALRAQELVEEATAAAAIALPPTPTKERVVLGEISNNSNPILEMPGNNDMKSKKAGTKGKKGRTGKKAKKEAKTKEAQQVEILEDDQLSTHSDAVEQACSDLRSHNSNSESAQIAKPDRATTPPSPAVEMATMQVSRMHSENTAQADIAGENLKGDHDQRLLDEHNSERIGGPTDGRQEQTGQGSLNDSFVEHIKSRSPAKRHSRIEDSVEALDALEDAIEKVDEAIPATASDRSSPADRKKPKAKAEKPTSKTSKASTSRTKSLDKKSPAPIPTRTKSARTQKSLNPATTANPLSPQREIKDITSTNSAARKPHETRPPKRVSSIHKTPFQPSKSTKPITKSTFELPGDAVARKLKEQREERQKREEESQSKAREFKAKPFRTSQAPEVKLTATTRARLSLAQQPAPAKIIKTSSAPRASVAPAVASVTRKPVPENKGQRGNHMHVARPKLPSSANTSAKRGPSLSSSMVSRQPSTASQHRPAPTADEVSQQRSRGKEVFGRMKVHLSEKEKEKKTKEEAARKARADAAERGRLASREWAEKQKVKKLASQKGNASPSGKAAAV